MSRLYSATNKIRFTSISENYQVNRGVKGKLSELHSSVISYVIKHFDGTMLYKQRVVKILNILTYALYAAEPLPFDWSKTEPFVNVPDIDDDLLEETLGSVYLTVDAIDWDITPVDNPSIIPGTSFQSIVTDTSVDEVPIVKEAIIKETPSTDLYIQAPEIPQFDVTKPWVQKQCGADLLTIYTTLPEIPKRQRDISITTDVSKMTDSDLLNLYPNHFIRTRAPIMYEPQTNMHFDKDFGVILPIDDYSKEQVVENIIRYPHLYKLAREQNNELVSFYAYMEINGELVDTLEVWDSLEISKWIPKNAEFIKEYVVRKYLMDMEIKGVEFKYPIYGTLQPYLTLFMPVQEYANRNYDVVDLARTCVRSRVSYKQSRSPILRRIREDA
jgi:hypothetical protein